ncbi:uncharacterized protein LOC121865060 [Homarus americanus]|uniref:Putative Alcohol dehydrogenase transcription factor Myb/SANT-like-containing protein 29 n=1 Tax=Homarus americanus TaxID=6706 RepID=A0A8J5N058_HOMAM|nr:uncharacterized protein LOC121865060 [Homarus americanus]KAG7170119.1 putative Alcohol dehydrogenase transcription factor Myb/SANT-like-containing protein 29 [Homarus americanus]
MAVSSTQQTINYGRHVWPNGKDVNAGNAGNAADEIRRQKINSVWTVSMEEMLIYFVKANPLLWDPKHPHFTKPMLKRRKVDDIAAVIQRDSAPNGEFTLTGEDIWRKYRNMRNFFLREVKRTSEKRRESGDDEYTSKWVHFNRLRYLLTPLKLKLNSNQPDFSSNEVGNRYSFLKEERQNISTAVNEENTRLQQDWREEVRVGGEWESVPEQVASTSNMSVGSTSTSQPVHVPASTEPCVPPTNQRKPKNPRLMNSDDLQKAAKVLQSFEKDPGDVAESFGTFIATSLRTLSEESQHILIAKITRVMAEFHSEK